MKTAKSETKFRTAKRKHIPQRTCVGCRDVLPKRSLTRVVRITPKPGAEGEGQAPTSIQIDPSGKLAGRGAYVHDRRSCWERALKGALAGALHAELAEADRERLLAFIQTLPEESENGFA